MTKEEQKKEHASPIPADYWDTIADVGFLVNSYGADMVAQDLLKNYPNEVQQLMLHLAKLMKTPMLLR